MTRTSNTILNKSGKSGYPCFVTDLLFITEYVSCQLVIYGLHYVEICSFYPLSGDFCHKWCWTFFTRFFCIYWDDYIFLFFSLLMQYINLWILNHDFITMINPSCSWCMIFLMYCWNQFDNILFWIFYIFIHQLLTCDFLYCDIFSGFVSKWCWTCRMSSRVFLPQ